MQIQLSLVDRGVYETLDLRVARHPSETEAMLSARVLAFALEYREGLRFTKGLAEPDAPAIEQRDLTGALQSWVEVGAPDAARLHRASKAAPRVVVYAFQDADRYWSTLAHEPIHRAAAIELRAFAPDLMSAWTARLERRMSFELSVSDGTLYLTHEGQLLSGDVRSHRLAG